MHKKSAQNCSLKKLARDNALRKLSDSTLLTRLERLCGTEREVQLNILYHLIEIDWRRLYLSMGYASLFEFSTGYLKYSNSAAGRRIGAARCIGRFPEVAEMFVAGEINLTPMALISGILTKENYREILDWVKGRPFRDVEMLVSRHRPERYLRDRVRPVCIMTGNTSLSIHPEGAAGTASNGGVSTPAAVSDITGDTPATPQTGFVNASPEGCNAHSTPNIGSEKFPGIHNIHGEKELERVKVEQKFPVQFFAEPDFMEMIKRVTSLLSTMYSKGMTLEMVFTILMRD